MPDMLAFTTLFLASLIGQPPAAPATKAPKGPDPLAEVRKQLPATDVPVVLVVRMELKPGAEAEFEKLARAAEAGTHKEPGAIAYEFSRSAADPRKFMLYEHWRSFGDLQKHFELDHTKAILAKFPEFAAGPLDLTVHLPLSK